MVLTNNDPKNPPKYRAAIDDKVSFLPDMLKVDVNQPMNPKHEITAPDMPSRGLSSDAFKKRLVDKMSPGPLVQPNPSKEEYVASNPNFDPTAKQVFAALNYGYRPHGSSTEYGYSYLVLSDSFKCDALYFAGDTFYSTSGGYKNSAEHAISFQCIFGLLTKAGPNMLRDMVRSCVNWGKCDDTKEPDLLLEVHIFDVVKMSGGVEKMCVSFLDSSGKPMSDADKEDVYVYAKHFADKHGIKLEFIDGSPPKISTSTVFKSEVPGLK